MTKLNFVRSADQIAGKSAFLINGYDKKSIM